jgi:GxxExxY protein
MKIMKKREFSNLSNTVIGCAIEVHKTLGPGLLESTYQRCLAHELKINQIEFKIEHSLPVKYKGIYLDIGYKLDLIIESEIILELKTVEQLNGIHEAQLLTYMKLANIKQGFLINFNVKLLKQGLKSFVL